ncbi:unnamed protein product [Diatraea saccharalis]|uniref:Hemicentin-1-like von Willebrand factor A domain-containing protein n=1 Tax=Diatraea saccharalis TaxID=40085 RepID=A0A9N9N2S6_9NEOP|nr:unnamed protein product [Diatraea saccharalis]
MENEIQEIQQNIPDIMNVLANMTEFNYYVLIPFNDAESVQPLVTTNPYKLMDSLNELRGSGGKECPEDSLSAIQKALEISEPESYIFLFTDGNAKYVHQLWTIENLCRETRSQIVIFLTGSCSDRDPGGVGHIDVYYHIARSCSGTVFNIAAVNIRKAFKYIRNIVKTDYNRIVNHEPFAGYKEFNVVRVSNLKTGTYRATARSQGSAYVTFYMRNKLRFEYGFSPMFPNSLKETCLRPMPGRTNYILIALPEIENLKINEALLDFVGSNLTKRVMLYEHPTRKGCYTSSVLLEPGKAFRMTIIGKNITTYSDITGSTIIIQTQNQNIQAKYSSPTSEIIQPDTALIDYETNATLVCKVRGYPKPQIWWEDENRNTLKSEVSA